MQTSTSGFAWKPPVDFTFWFVEDCILDALLLSNYCKWDVIKKNLTTLIPTTQLYRIEVANFDKREMQNKILEAMAMKVPVITTSYANASLGAVDREHVLIANNKKEFAQRIAELLDNNELRIKLMDNAYLYINEHFTKDVIAAKVLRLVGE